MSSKLAFVFAVAVTLVSGNSAQAWDPSSVQGIWGGGCYWEPGREYEWVDQPVLEYHHDDSGSSDDVYEKGSHIVVSAPGYVPSIEPDEPGSWQLY